MKKLSVIILLGILSAALLGGCAKKADTAETEPVEISVVEVEEVEEPEVNLHEGEARSDLTGEWIDAELAAQRPFAVMMGNTKIATPQYGIGSADVIYEAPVEGSETRLMPIFQNYQSLEKVMSIRSCRLYYIDWALEFDAIYGHYGQSYLAEDMLKNSYVNNLSGLDGSVEKVMYSRDSDRKAPHNAYTTGEGIQAGIALKGYETQHSADYKSHYKFNEDEENEIVLKDASAAAVVVPGYLVNKPWFVYNSESGLYERFQNGDAHIDGATGEQLAVKNIIIQICDWRVADENADYLDITTTGSGSGYYVTNGSAIPITWSKNSQTEATKYYDSNGEEITLNRGKTWVCITQNTYQDRITFYANEEEFLSAE